MVTIGTGMELLPEYVCGIYLVGQEYERDVETEEELLYREEGKGDG